jgi:hypothetical protein
MSTANPRARAALCALLFAVCLLLSACREPGSPHAAGAAATGKEEAIVRSASSVDWGLAPVKPGESVFFQFPQDSAKEPDFAPIPDPGTMEPALYRLPWPLMPYVSYAVASDGVLYAAINRIGVLIIVQRDSGTPRWALIRDNRIFSNRSIGSAWVYMGRFYVFVSRNSAYEEGSAESAIVSIEAGENSFRREPLVAPSVLRSGERVTYYVPVDGESAFAQVSRDLDERTESGYLRAALGKDTAERVGQNAYLSAVEPSKRSAIDSRLVALCDPKLASARYLSGLNASQDDFAVFLQSLAADRPQEDTYVLTGSSDSLWGAYLYSWEDATGLAVLYPDGRLRLGSKDGSVSDVSLPALPGTFDYERVAFSGDLVLVTWAESVWPEKGRSGFALYLRR